MDVPCFYSCYLSSLGYSIFELNCTHRCDICPQYSKISVIWIFHKCTITVTKIQLFNYTIIVTNQNLNAHFMLNVFVTPVLIFCCNSHKLMSFTAHELSEIIRLCKYACVLVNPICNSWHQQWHSVERPYSVNQQKRLNITAKCHNGVLSLIIDCRLTFYPSYQKKHPLWATAYCFNKITWKCCSSPVTIQSSVHPSK